MFTVAIILRIIGAATLADVLLRRRQYQKT